MSTGIRQLYWAIIGHTSPCCAATATLEFYPSFEYFSPNLPLSSCEDMMSSHASKIVHVAKVTDDSDAASQFRWGKNDIKSVMFAMLS